MDHQSEPAFAPQDLMVHDGLLIPCCVMLNYDAHMGVDVTETSEYLVAHSKCTVPQQRTFTCFAELDSQIIGQLQAKSFSMALVPNLPVKVHRIASRIRNEWTVKYGLKFRDQDPNDEMAPHALLQQTGMAGETVDVLPTGMQHPDTGSSILTRYTPPAGPMRTAGGGAFITFPTGYQHPNMVPGEPTPHMLPPDRLQLIDKFVELINVLLSTGIQHPNTVPGMPTPYMPPADLPQLIAVFIEIVKKLPTSIQHPNTVPGMPAPYMPPCGIMHGAGGDAVSAFNNN